MPRHNGNLRRLQAPQQPQDSNQQRASKDRRAARLTAKKTHRTRPAKTTETS